MASTLSWCSGFIISTFDPNSSQNNLIELRASLFVSSVGVSTHHLSSNNSANPASGPDNSVPAIGCPGIKLTPIGITFESSSITFSFEEPVSVTIQPGFKL